MPSGSILVADDDAAIRTVLNQALSRAGYEVRSCGNAATLWRWVSQGDGDLVITDVVMPDENAFDLLPRIKKARPDLPVIVMSAQNTFMTAIRASERGAYEYLPKPFDLKELISIVGRALSEPKKGDGHHHAPEEQDNIPLVGRSPAMQEIYRLLARLMQTDLTVMIAGESGTGKELVARALHDYGKRRTGPFVAINMAAIPRDLIESELFGYEAGAFTGAHKNGKPGMLELANHGTLFLDEIGELPLDMQVKLLHVLQDRTVARLGSTRSMPLDIRIVAATNRDLARAVEASTFRADLFYRLNVVPIVVPPLRERREDILPLIRQALSGFNAQYRTHKQFSHAAALELVAYDWPGNIRELRNLVERLVVTSPGTVIEAEELGIAATPAGADHPQEPGVAHIERDGLGLGEQVRRFETALIESALQRFSNTRAAARYLGVSQSTIVRKMKGMGETPG